VRTRRGATATRPIFELWTSYSEVSGGREDVDGGRLRVDPEEVLSRRSEPADDCRGVGPFPQDGGQGDRPSGAAGVPADPAAGTSGDRALSGDPRRLAGRGSDASAEAGHTAQRTYERLRDEHGYAGSASSVRRYVASQKVGHGEVFMPLYIAPGEEAQQTPFSTHKFCGGPIIITTG
jgi:hypothetical protein